MSPTPSLTAIYTSPTSPAKDFTTVPLPSLSSASPAVTEKSAYLSALRKNVTALQADINAFLTAKMEEDKTQAGVKADDKKEEERYGEEGEEEDGA